MGVTRREVLIGLGAVVAGAGLAPVEGKHRQRKGKGRKRAHGERCRKYGETCGRRKKCCGDMFCDAKGICARVEQCWYAGEPCGPNRPCCDDAICTLGICTDPVIEPPVE